MSPDTRNLLIVLGVGAVLGALAVPEVPAVTGLASSEAPAPVSYQPNASLIPVDGVKSDTSVDTLVARIARLKNDSDIVTYDTHDTSSLIQYPAGSMVPPRSIVSDERMSGYTARVPILPIDTDLLTSSIRRPMAGQGDFTPQIPLQSSKRSSPRTDPYGTVLNRSGASNQYFDQNGDSYTQAGPHGVVSNRTGEFNPTN